MNKRRIDNYIPKAYQVLQEVEIANDGKINNGYRGQIASFGAMISMGSILSAVALFCRSSQKDANGSNSKDKEEGKEKSKETSKEVDRCKLLQAIYYVIDGKTDKVKFFEYVQEEIKAGNEMKTKEMILEAAAAVKLAMNLYEINT